MRCTFKNMFTESRVFTQECVIFASWNIKKTYLMTLLTRWNTRSLLIAFYEWDDVINIVHLFTVHWITLIRVVQIFPRNFFIWYSIVLFKVLLWAGAFRIYDTRDYMNIDYSPLIALFMKMRRNSCGFIRKIRI